MIGTDDTKAALVAFGWATSVCDEGWRLWAFGQLHGPLTAEDVDRRRAARFEMQDFGTVCSCGQWGCHQMSNACQLGVNVAG
jgi:hypothetical protein